MECALGFNFGVCRMFNKYTKVAGRCPNYTNCCVRLVLESPPPLTPSSSRMFLCPLSILSPLFLSSHLLPFLPFSPPQLPLLSHLHILFPFPLSSPPLPSQDHEDPFYVVDLGRLLELYRGWREALPTVSPFYAVKCNDDPALLKTLAALGTGFDCASKVVYLCTNNRMCSQHKKSERLSVEGTHSGVLPLTSFFLIGTYKQTMNVVLV